jgi:hypothetical protein
MGWLKVGIFSLARTNSGVSEPSLIPEGRKIAICLLGGPLSDPVLELLFGTGFFIYSEAEE